MLRLRGIPMMPTANKVITMAHVDESDGVDQAIAMLKRVYDRYGSGAAVHVATQGDQRRRNDDRA